MLAGMRFPAEGIVSGKVVMTYELLHIAVVQASVVFWNALCICDSFMVSIDISSG